MQTNSNNKNLRSIISVSSLSLILLSLANIVACSGEISKEDRDQYGKALVLYNNRNFKESEQIASDLLDDYEDWSAPRLLRAKIYFFTRRFAAAEKDLREVIARDVHHPYANLWLAKVVATDETRTKEATELLKELTERNPDDVVAHYYLARCYEKSGDYSQAIVHYQHAVGAEYHLSKAHLHLGTLLKAHELDRRAQKHFRKVELLNINKEDARKARNLIAVEASPDDG